MSSIVLVSMGSWGDLFPFVGLARELQARGHNVCVAASPAWADVVAEAGVPFRGVGRAVGFAEMRRHPEIFRPAGLGLRHALDRFLFDQVDEITVDLQEAFADADLAVVHPAHVVAHNVAEALDLRRVVATVFPTMLRSGYTVPPGTPVGPFSGPVGRVLNRASWLSAEAGTALLFDRRINRHREVLGLRPLRPALFRLISDADAVVVLASSEVLDVPPDWPSKFEVTSFVTWDRAPSRPVDNGTEAFLAAEGDIAVITLGSSSALHPGDFFGIATEAARAQGLRALIVLGPAPKPALDRGPDMHITDYVPFSVVMPRVRLAIHHGGLGTTVEAICAGIPQVVVPKGFDQPLTAARIADLGLGIVVPWRRRRRRITGAVRHVLTTSSFAERAAHLGHAVRQRDGAKLTADAIERRL